MSSSRSLLQVGAQCSQPSCNQIDFLPIVCQCEQTFCNNHYKPQDHDCSLRTPAGQEADKWKTTPKPLKRCEMSSCSELALNAFHQDSPPTCNKCFLSLCARHRYIDAHDCLPVVQSESISKKAEARALLGKHFLRKAAVASKSKQRPAKPPTPQQKKIELIKMRHHAKAGDPKDRAITLPVDQRIHVKVKGGDVESTFWFRKNLSTGRALDCLASHFGMDTSKPVRLFQLEGIPLQNESLFAQEIQDGDTIMLEYL